MVPRRHPAGSTDCSTESIDESYTLCGGRSLSEPIAATNNSNSNSNGTPKTTMTRHNILLRLNLPDNLDLIQLGRCKWSSDKLQILFRVSQMLQLEPHKALFLGQMTLSS